MNSAAVKLLPCPFCGGKAELCGGWADGYHVACDGCECDLGRNSSEGEPAHDFISAESAIAAWNRRAPAKEDG